MKNKKSKTGRREEPVVPAEARELGDAIKIVSVSHQLQTSHANQTPVLRDRGFIMVTESVWVKSNEPQ